MDIARSRLIIDLNDVNIDDLPTRSKKDLRQEMQQTGAKLELLIDDEPAENPARRYPHSPETAAARPAHVVTRACDYASMARRYASSAIAEQRGFALGHLCLLAFRACGAGRSRIS